MASLRDVFSACPRGAGHDDITLPLFARVSKVVRRPHRRGEAFCGSTIRRGRTSARLKALIDLSVGSS
jgi:hypothetical protein